MLLHERGELLGAGEGAEQERERERQMARRLQLQHAAPQSVISSDAAPVGPEEAAAAAVDQRRPRRWVTW